MRHDDTRPFARPLLVGRAAPFALAMVLAVATLPLSGNDLHPVPAVAAALLTVAIAAAAWFVPWTRLPAWLEALPPLAWFGVAELLRTSAGGSPTGYAPLIFLPVLWLLLYGTRPQMMLSIAGLGASLLAPLVLDGQATVAGLRIVALRTLIAAVVCVTVFRLVTAVRRQAVELERLASTDPLTGLPNRRVWEDALPRELARSSRAGTPVAIVMLDLDSFKAYNDHHGHQGGDLLLKETAAQWPAELRESDVLARYGGEEFALILPDCGIADVYSVVEKVRGATPSGVTCSAGVAIWDGVEDPASLILRADKALYAAKHGGRDMSVVAGAADGPEAPKAPSRPPHLA
jgi:diguanylate cyclase (GGDEF)-like protein